MTFQAKLSLEVRQIIAALLIVIISLVLILVICFLGIVLLEAFTLGPHFGIICTFDAYIFPILMVVFGLIHFSVNVYQLEGWLLFRRQFARCKSPDVIQRLKNQFQAAGVTVALFVFAILVCCLMMLSSDDTIDKRIQLHMQNYRLNGYMKEIVDLLQMTFECCGRRGYKDWFGVKWIRIKYLPYIYPPPEENLQDDVPFSCCDPNANRPCVHYGVMRENAHYKYDPDYDLTLYKVGCTTAVADYLRGVYGSFVLLLFLLIALQVVIMFLTRLLFTSHYAACRKGDPTLTATGHLFRQSPKPCIPSLPPTPPPPLRKVSKPTRLSKPKQKLRPTMAHPCPTLLHTCPPYAVCSCPHDYLLQKQADLYSAHYPAACPDECPKSCPDMPVLSHFGYSISQDNSKNVHVAHCTPRDELDAQPQKWF